MSWAADIRRLVTRLFQGRELDYSGGGSDGTVNFRVWDEQQLCSVPGSSKISVGKLVKDEKFSHFRNLLHKLAKNTTSEIEWNKFR